MNFKIEGPHSGKSSLCEPILRCLPEWFGIEEAIVNYVREINSLPTLLARDGEQVLGFLTIKQHNPHTAEIYVMGVPPEAHRNGIGKSLVHASEVWLREQGVEYLQVKTLGPSHPDENYASTRSFYTAMGFRPLEEFTQIWGEQNPCLLMVKRL
jgi:ribosomal protein S18 acetylase RimI-like enzyme